MVEDDRTDSSLGGLKTDNRVLVNDRTTSGTILKVRRSVRVTHSGSPLSDGKLTRLG